MKRSLALLVLLISCRSSQATDVFSGGAPTCSATDAYEYALSDATEATAVGCGTSGGSTYVDCICLAGSLYLVAPTVSGSSGAIVVEEDNSAVDSAVTNLDFTEPDATVVTSSPAGEANLNLAGYVRLAGRSGGQHIYGGSGATDHLDLSATSDIGTSINTLYARVTGFQFFHDNGDSILFTNGSSKDWFSAISSGGYDGAVTIAGSSPLYFGGSTEDSNYTHLDVTDPTAARAIKVPNNDVVIPVASTCTNQVFVSLNGTTGAFGCSDITSALIASDAVTEPKLKAVNSPTDEYPLTYESTTGDFEWQILTPPAGGTGSAPTGDDYVPIADSTTAVTWRQIPDCNSDTSVLQYDQATNAWSCATIGRIPEIENPPASPSSYDDEFNSTSLDGKWSWSNSGGSSGNPSAGTVDPLGTGTTTKYDLDSTWLGWLLWQSDNVSAGVNLLSQNWTSSTDATFVIRYLANPIVATQANAEGEVKITLWNSGDSNEHVYGIIKQPGTGRILRLSVENNGSFTTSDSGLIVNIQGLAEYLVVWKKSNDYYVCLFGESSGWLMVGPITKTGVTTFDRVGIEFSSDNVSPRIISGVDFFREYASVTMALKNP